MLYHYYVKRVSIQHNITFSQGGKHVNYRVEANCEKSWILFWEM